jgi:copper resistance protein C
MSYQAPAVPSGFACLDVTSGTVLCEEEVMQPGRRSPLMPILLSAVISFLFAASAAAHAVLLESHPSANGTVAGPDIPINLRFNVRLDSGRSRLTLVRPDGSAQLLTIGKPSSADTLSTHATSLLAGNYRLRWQVLASDGHITRGEIPFTVAPSS